MIATKKKSYINQITIVFSTVVIISILIVGYGASVVNRFVLVEDAWGGFHDESAKSSQLINNIRGSLGYGGFIHNFKNYIIRRDENLIAVIEDKIDSSYDSLAIYQSLKITDEEMKALEDLEDTIDSYSESLAIAKELISNNASLELLDSSVYVYDEPALEAINYLVAMSAKRHENKELEISKIIHESMVFSYYGLVIVPIVIVLGLVIIRYLRKLLDANIHLTLARNELNALLDESPDATIIVDNEGKIIRANSRATELFGYDNSELLSFDVEELLPDEFRSHHVQLRNKYMSSEDSRNLKPERILKVKTKDGSSRPVDISLSFHKRMKSNVVIATIRDMRSYYEFEEALKKERDFSNGIIETAQAIILVLDAQGRITEFNPYMENIFGHELVDVKGKDYISIFIPEDERELNGEMFLDAIRDIPTMGQINALVTKSGEKRYIEWYDKTLKDEKGDITGLIAMGQDVTERLKSQEMIRLQGAIVDHMAEGVNIVRASDGVLLYTNPVFNNMFGYGKDELINKHVSVLNTPDVEYPIDEAGKIIEAIKDHQKWNGEVYNVKKDGSGFWCESTITKFNHSEYGEVFLAVQSDITNQKLTELEIVKNQGTIRALLDAPKDRLVLIDVNGIVQALNLAEAKSLRLKMESAVGANYFDYLTDEFKRFIQKIIGDIEIKYLPEKKQVEIANQWLDVSVYPILDANNAITQFAILTSDITDLKYQEELRLLHAKEQKNILVREVHHRIKNNLQSVAGLLRRQGRKCPGLKLNMADAISQVESIAIIHGLQGTHDRSECLELSEIIEKISDAVTGLYRDDVDIEFSNALGRKYNIKSDEAVPFALVVNELITNAVKHCPTDSSCEAAISLQKHIGEKIRMEIKNIGSLAADFDLDNEDIIGTGLKLVRSLLPANDAEIHIYETDGYVIAQLILDTAVIMVD